MQIYIGSKFEPPDLHLAHDQPVLAFEADICTWWKGITVQWISELLFHLLLRILAIDIVIFIDVIYLSHQIIELGKDRDNGYCKMLIGDLKHEDGVI